MIRLSPVQRETARLMLECGWNLFAEGNCAYIEHGPMSAIINRRTVRAMTAKGLIMPGGKRGQYVLSYAARAQMELSR